MNATEVMPVNPTLPSKWVLIESCQKSKPVCISNKIRVPQAKKGRNNCANHGNGTEEATITNFPLHYVRH